MEQIYLSLTATLFSRPLASPASEWSVLDTGPGWIDLPAGHEFGFRVHTIDDDDLALLLKELSGLEPLTFANLSENRRITDDGVKQLQKLPQLKELNLSSCGLTNEGIAHLQALSQLSSLDLSYCNRLTGPALKPLRALTHLKKLNLQGCIKIKTGDVARFQKPGLEIKK